MAQTERRTLEIVASVKDFASNTLGKIGKGFAAMGKGAMSALGGLARAITSVRGVLVGFLGVLAVRGTKGLIDWQAQLSRTAKSIGTTTEQLSTLSFAFTQSGLAAEQSTDAVRELLKNAGQAIREPGGKRDAFAAIGISVDDLRRSQPVELFERIASALSRFSSESEKLFMLDELFGGVGQQLKPLFDQGPEGFRRLAEEAKRLGLVLSTDAGEKAESFRQSWEKLQQVLEAVLGEFLRTVLPLLTEKLNDWSRWIADNRERVIEFFRDVFRWAERLATALGKVVEWMREMDILGMGGESGRLRQQALDELIGEEAKARRLSRFEVAAMHAEAGIFSEEQIRARMAILRGPTGGGAGGSGGAGGVPPESMGLPPGGRSGSSEPTPGSPSWWQGFKTGISNAAAEWEKFEQAGIAAGQSILDGGLNGLTDALTSIVTGAAKAKDAFKDWAKAVLHELIRIINHLIVMKALGFVTGIFSAGASAGTTTSQADIGGYGALEQGGAVNRTLLGVGRPGSWRKFEYGGVAYGPTMALFGEGSASSGEAFVPLRGGRIPVQIAGGTFGGGGNVTVNIQAIDAPSFEQRLAQHPGAIRRAVEQELRRKPDFVQTVRKATR